MSQAATAEAPEAKAPRMTAKVKREIVAKRQDGITLAELRKAYPQFTSEQIREVLAAAEPPTTAQGYSGSGETVGERQPEPEPKRTRGKTQPKPASNGGTTDKKHQAQAAKAPAKAKTERKPIDAKLAQRAVAMRGKLDDKGRPTSWAKIAFALKLVPEGAPKAQAGDAARRAYRQVRGQDAPTGPSDY